MRYLRKLYHFLGGIWFALALIAATALFVITGTLIESSTGSHRLAASLTYSHPLFLALLFGFFINILFSALRRWPFQVKHVPFLVTHIGLLMILGGAMIKTQFGVQGTMNIIEGTGSNHIVEAGTYALEIEKQDGSLEFVDISSLQTKKSVKIDQMLLDLVQYTPHCNEHLLTWIKGDFAYIGGLDPLPVHQIGEISPSDPIPLSGKARFCGKTSSIYHLYALRCDTCCQIVNQLYFNHATLEITERKSGNKIASLPLAGAIEKPMIELKDGCYQGKVHCQVNLGFSDLTGFHEPNLTWEYCPADKGCSFQAMLALNGDVALLNQNLSAPYLGSPPLALDIVCSPFLAIIQDSFFDTYLVACNAHGKVWWQPFSSERLHSYLAYNEGFLGYAVQAKPPFSSYLEGRTERENALNEFLKIRLNAAASEKAELSPPLKLLKEASARAKLNFPSTLLAFLNHWNDSYGWLYDETIPLPSTIKEAFQEIDWGLDKDSLKHALDLTLALFDQIEEEVNKGGNLLSLLQNTGWPLTDSLKALCKTPEAPTDEETAQMLTLISYQIFSAGKQLPTLPTPLAKKETPERQARLLSAYMRLFGIHLSTITPQLAEEEMHKYLLKAEENTKTVAVSQEIALETELFPLQIPASARTKPEDNIPALTLRAKSSQKEQTLSLAYDPNRSKLKWPLLGGLALARFSPKLSSIPYRIRLRQARQINYGNTTQAYGYESDIIVKDLRSKESVETTISMNRVHETWDGFRFYLSGISPGDESAVKRVQIVVNYDPAKYLLTYPGALILTLGIILLFLMRPYKHRNQ